MKSPGFRRGKREQGSSLVMVMLGSFICLTIAVSLVTARNQAMKLAKREQLAHLAQLDLQTQATNLNNQIASLVNLESLNNSLSDTNAGAFVNQLAAAGSLLSDPSNGGVRYYNVGGGQLSFSIAQPSWQYPPLNNPPDISAFAPLTTALTDPADSLLDVQRVRLLGTMPVKLTAAPSSNTNVFYPSKAVSMTYDFREVPISIYSLYATGSTSITAGDFGRIYVGQNLTVTGAVTASRPLIAQLGITFSDGDSQLKVGTETLPSNGGSNDLVQMKNGNQILTAGMQEKGLQVVSNTNFGDPTNSSLAQLASGCALDITYASQPPAVNGIMSGSATVLLHGEPTGDTNVRVDSNLMNGSWDNPSMNLPKPAGYMAAVTAGGTRLMSPGGTPMQFIVFDYVHLSPINSQTIYIHGDPAAQAVLVRGGVVPDTVPGTTKGAIIGGLSIVSNLDIYIYQGIAPVPALPAATPPFPAISIITPGRVHAVY